MLILTLMFNFSLVTSKAEARSAKRIVNIKLETPKKKAQQKTRSKQKKKVVVINHRNDYDVEVEPLKGTEKLANRGILREWDRKNKKRKKHKKRRIAYKKQKKRRAPTAEKSEDETKMRDRDIEKVLKKMKGSTETELLTEYEGSF